jgi:hypothetical protein
MNLLKEVDRSVWQKAITVTIALILSAFLVVGESVPAFAYADYGDKGFAFDLTSTGDTAGTPWYKKGTDSSVYINVQYRSGTAPRGYVDGANSSSGTNKKDCTIGTVYLSKTGEYRFRNLVNESGLTYARLTAWASLGTGYVSGVWSPDCAGSYAYLN